MPDLPDAHRSLRVLLVRPAGVGGVATHLARVAPALARRVPLRTVVGAPLQEAVAGWSTLAAQLGQAAVVHLNPSLRHRALARDLALTLAARRRGARVVWQLHGIDPRLVALFDRTGFPVHRGPDHWLVLHEGVGGMLRRWGVAAERIDVVGPCARAWDLPARDPAGPWLYLGRLARGKGVGRLLQAARRPVVVVGEGPERRRLERQARQLGVRARFVGWVDDPAPWLARCAGLVLPSDGEGLPVSVLEALGSGRPVVASAVGGLPYVLPGRALVPPGDVGALRRALHRVTDLPAATRDAVRARYAPDAIAEQLVAVYDKVMETT